MYRKLIASALPFIAVACAGMEAPPTANVPDQLRPGANEALALVIPASGVQIYECRAKAQQPGAYEWAFLAPEADLFYTNGRKAGSHYAGPHWEAADGSRISGQLKERADAPQKGAIPWLLLTTKSVGPDGSFSKVTSIQRVNTVGGVAPASGCSQSTAGTIARVPYTADYYLLSAK
jgi:hypothetical protein